MKMNHWIMTAVAFATMATSLTARAIDERGNGGKIIMPQAIPLDYYEAETQFGWTLDVYNLPGNEWEIARALIDRLKGLDDDYTFLDDRLKSFWASTNALAGVELTATSDALEIALPTGSTLKQLFTQRTPNALNPKRYTLSKDLWDQMSPPSRAGMVVHEILLEVMARKVGATDTRKARALNGLLASDLWTKPEFQTRWLLTKRDIECVDIMRCVSGTILMGEWEKTDYRFQGVPMGLSWWRNNDGRIWTTKDSYAADGSGPSFTVGGVRMKLHPSTKFPAGGRPDVNIGWDHSDPNPTMPMKTTEYRDPNRTLRVSSRTGNVTAITAGFDGPYQFPVAGDRVATLADATKDSFKGLMRFTDEGQVTCGNSAADQTLVGEDGNDVFVAKDAWVKFNNDGLVTKVRAVGAKDNHFIVGRELCGMVDVDTDTRVGCYLFSAKWLCDTTFGYFDRRDRFDINGHLMNGYRAP